MDKLSSHNYYFKPLNAQCGLINLNVKIRLENNDNNQTLQFELAVRGPRLNGRRLSFLTDYELNGMNK